MAYLDRRQNWGALMDEFEAWSRTLDSKLVLAALSKNSVPAAEYRAVKDVMDDPQLAHRKAFNEVTDAGGTFKVLNPAFRMSDSRTAAGPKAPVLGEHTLAVLRDAGFSADAIGALNVRAKSVETPK